MMNDNYDWYQKSKYDCRLSGRWRVVILVIEQLSKKERGDDDDGYDNYEDEDDDDYDDYDDEEEDDDRDINDEDHDEHLDCEHYQAN